jgi:hypothetical protein
MRQLTIGVCVMLLASACSSPEQPGRGGSAPASAASTPATPAPATPAPAAPAPDEPLPDVPSPYDVLPAATREVLDRPFTGDLDEMAKRRLIRAGVVFNRTQYFVDRGQQRSPDSRRS